jgi:hypothetical protein
VHIVLKKAASLAAFLFVAYNRLADFTFLAVINDKISVSLQGSRRTQLLMRAGAKVLMQDMLDMQRNIF